MRAATSNPSTGTSLPKPTERDSGPTALRRQRRFERPPQVRPGPAIGRRQQYQLGDGATSERQTPQLAEHAK
jgi:hypothetical protein